MKREISCKSNGKQSMSVNVTRVNPQFITNLPNSAV